MGRQVNYGARNAGKEKGENVMKLTDLEPLQVFTLDG